MGRLSRRTFIVGYVAGLLVLGVGMFAVFWYTVLRTYHLTPVDPGILYRCGNRGLGEFKHAIALTNSHTVISLIDDHELADPAKPQFQQEIEYCRDNGIQMIRIPVPLGGWPGNADLQKFFDSVSNTKNQPVLLHCAQGVRRTGMFVAAYQESVLHQSPQQAEAEIQTFNHKPRDVDDVRTFIHDYDPASHTLKPATRPVNAE